MSAPIDDGPFHPIITTPGVTLIEHTGISLRDYFAAAAMQELRSAWYQRQSEENSWKVAAKHLAEDCYIIADAMLAARKEVAE